VRWNCGTNLRSCMYMKDRRDPVSTPGARGSLAAAQPLDGRAQHRSPKPQRAACAITFVVRCARCHYHASARPSPTHEDRLRTVAATKLGRCSFFMSERQGRSRCHHSSPILAPRIHLPLISPRLRCQTRRSRPGGLPALHALLAWAPVHSWPSHAIIQGKHSSSAFEPSWPRSRLRPLTAITWQSHGTHTLVSLVGSGSAFGCFAATMEPT